MKSIVKQRTVMYCENCDEEIYWCDGCNNYFEPNDNIFCQLEIIPNSKNKHYCKDCAKEDLNEIKIFSSICATYDIKNKNNEIILKNTASTAINKLKGIK